SVRGVEKCRWEFCGCVSRVYCRRIRHGTNSRGLSLFNGESICSQGVSNCERDLASGLRTAKGCRQSQEVGGVSTLRTNQRRTSRSRSRLRAAPRATGGASARGSKKVEVLEFDPQSRSYERVMAFLAP